MDLATARPLIIDAQRALLDRLDEVTASDGSSKR
jgi:hypothetical protein